MFKYCPQCKKFHPVDPSFVSLTEINQEVVVVNIHVEGGINLNLGNPVVPEMSAMPNWRQPIVYDSPEKDYSSRDKWSDIPTEEWSAPGLRPVNLGQQQPRNSTQHNRRFSFTNLRDRSRASNWMFWLIAGLVSIWLALLIALAVMEIVDELNEPDTPPIICDNGQGIRDGLHPENIEPGSRDECLQIWSYGNGVLEGNAKKVVNECRKGARDGQTGKLKNPICVYDPEIYERYSKDYDTGARKRALILEALGAGVR